EGTGERQTFLRQVQGGTQEGRLTRDVREPQAQAEAGL
ncbi:MAG: LSU ribosomal protein L36p @ LSU ribosomal protein L36p, zinc-dependent, partial [uncultured Rubrobacteraceae bacterium]